MTYNVSAGKYEALEKENERLRECERELCAQVERLREAVQTIFGWSKEIPMNHNVRKIFHLCEDTLNETPAQSLREIRAEAGREGFEAGFWRALDPMHGSPVAEADLYAQRIREGKE